MQTLTKLSASIRTRGVVGTVRLGGLSGAWALAPRTCNRIERRIADRAERRFDRRFGTDTVSIRSQPVADAPAASRSAGSPYEATMPGAFKRIVRAAGCLPEERVFVDIGCGKGKVLLLAAERRFARVVGVEHSPRLAGVARRNLAIFSDYLAAAPAEVHEGDALAYELPKSPLFMFMYNPFDAAVMTEFVERMRGALAACPRPMTLAYLNPRHAEVLDGSRFLRRSGVVKTYVNSDCYLYESQ